MLLCNMTSNIIFNEVCWDLPYYLHNFDYLFTCYTDKFINSLYGIGKAFLYILFKSPLDHVPMKSPQESVKVDIPLEYFPSLIQQSHRTDLINSEAGEVFIYKPDFTVIVSSKLKSLLRVAHDILIYLTEINCLRLCFIIYSITMKLIVLRVLFQILCCLLHNGFKIFLYVLYFSALVLYVRASYYLAIVM